MKRNNIIVNRNTKDIAKSLKLTPADVVEWETRSTITKKIIEMAKYHHLSVTQIAKDSGTSRGRVTRILKDDTLGISLDVLLRVLGATGQTIKLSFHKAA
jgi:predicted XRE-type DNA-binding protein